MSLYVLAPNGSVQQYPFNAVDLRLANPGTSFPNVMSDALLAEFGVYPVTQVPVPAYDTMIQNLVEGTPVNVGGVWTQTWSVADATPEQIAQRMSAIKDAITAQVQQRLDDFARTRGYDNIVSACSYATSTHAKYGPEGRYCVTAREDTWDTMFSIEAQVQAGLRPIPLTYEEIEPELPVLEWPV